MVTITNMIKAYEMGDTVVKALDGVSLSIEQNEFVSIVGPSGSGKSTLMNIIGCLDVATSGSYILDGQEISAYDDDDLADFRINKIGFIFQRYNLLPRLSVVENVELPLVYLGIGGSERRKRALESLKKVGLDNRAHHIPSELSGGQQQRVSIARAMVTKPSIILADEPTGALDSKTGKEVLKLLQDLHKAGNTIILITHDMDIAKKASRIVRISDGKIISDENICPDEEVIQHEAVASY